MSIFREIPPTAGWPIQMRHLIVPLFAGMKSGALEEDFKEYFGLPYCRLNYSGTASFYIILESLKSLSRKKTVIIPGLVCPLIPLAIKRAGLKVAACDINDGDFGFDLHKLSLICSQNSDILAILAVHLAGLPVDLDALKEVVSNRDIFVVEDCAQSLGAEYKNKKTGTWGDFGFFSLCRGKGLSIYEGGLAVTKVSQYGRLLEDNFKKFANNDFVSEGVKILELFAYWLFYRPRLFWFAFRLPQLYWQARNNPLRAMGEYFTTAFPLHKVCGFRQAAGHLQFKELGRQIEKQRAKAKVYIDALKDSPGIRVITEAAGTKSNYPYLALIFDDQQRCARIKRKLLACGLGASLVYLSAIADYGYLKGVIPDADLKQSRKRSQDTITLSTSVFLKEKEIQRITDIIKKG